MKQISIRIMPLIIVMGLIYYLSSRTGEQVNTLLPWFQKLFPLMESFNWGHLVSYCILAATMDFAIGQRAAEFRWKLIIVLCCGLYGVTDEYHQSFVGGRMPDLHDIVNDMIGAMIWTIVISLPPLFHVWKKLTYRYSKNYKGK